MRRLFHWPLDPSSRLVRLALGEKRLDADETVHAPGEPAPDVARSNPGTAGPILLDRGAAGQVTVIGSRAIIEYLDDVYPSVPLRPAAAQDRAEARRLWQWCEEELAAVDADLLRERLQQWLQRDRQPDPSALRAGSHALRGRLTVLNALAEQRPFLAGKHLTVADFAAAARLSAYDYFGDVPWDLAPDLRDWYRRIKSRPAFRPLLKDRVRGTRPAAHYSDLDF